MFRVDFVQSVCSLSFTFYQENVSSRCFFPGFLSGPDSWNEAPGCCLTHPVAGEVGVPEKYKGLVSRAG